MDERNKHLGINGFIYSFMFTINILDILLWGQFAFPFKSNANISKLFYIYLLQIIQFIVW